MSTPAGNFREPLITSAVSFLQDPNVASSSLAKRLAFLESKGLTECERDEAIRRVSSFSHSSSFHRSGVNQGYDFDHRLHQQVGRDWRDWFIMSVIGGGIGYIAISLFKKFILPALEPPTQTELDEAKSRLEAKFDEISKTLNSIESDTNLIKEEFKEQDVRLKQSIETVEMTVKECIQNEKRRDEEIQSIEEEVMQLKKTITSMLETNKDSQTSMILELQTELRSLKSLLGSRTTQATTTPTTTANRFGPFRPPGIPAWQLSTTTSSLDSTALPPNSSNQTNNHHSLSNAMNVANEDISKYLDVKTNGNGVLKSNVPFDEDDDQSLDHQQKPNLNSNQDNVQPEKSDDLIS
ncbi:peroxisomal membrane anchor protein conserved region-domain-containing protein [Melampsora americana]|nr:peroxisomal membrane anchor protein conserved region-domain-containing protein [Melampsora americana]